MNFRANAAMIGTAAPEDAKKCKRELEQASVQGWHQGQLFFYRCGCSACLQEVLLVAVVRQRGMLVVSAPRGTRQAKETLPEGEYLPYALRATSKYRETSPNTLLLQ